MNKYVKEFFHRGLIFGGFGPIILGIVYAILDGNLKDFSLSGVQCLIAIVSIYFVAFIQAGASVFNQIEEWSLPKSLLCHFSMLYFAYIICYLINSWIPFNINVILIFSAIFVVSYFAVWSFVVVSVKMISRKLNKKIKL